MCLTCKMSCRVHRFVHTDRATLINLMPTSGTHEPHWTPYLTHETQFCCIFQTAVAAGTGTRYLRYWQRVVRREGPGAMSHRQSPSGPLDWQDLGCKTGQKAVMHIGELTFDDLPHTHKHQYE